MTFMLIRFLVLFISASFVFSISPFITASNNILRVLPKVESIGKPKFIKSVPFIYFWLCVCIYPYSVCVYYLKHYG